TLSLSRHRRRGPGDDLARAIETLRIVIDSSSQAIVALDLDGNCTVANAVAATTLLHRAEDLVGRNLHEVMHHSRPDGTPFPEATCPIYQAFRQSMPLHLEHEVFWRADGSPFLADYRSEPVLQDGVLLGSVVTFADVTELRRSEAAALARQLAPRGPELTDELTGIGNRAHAEVFLDSLRPGDAVVTIALDGGGSPDADAALVALAHHLQEGLRAGDNLARYAPDQFLVLVRGAATEAERVVGRMVDSWKATGATATFTAGIALYLGGPAAKAVELSERTLHAAQRAGGDRV